VVTGLAYRHRVLPKPLRGAREPSARPEVSASGVGHARLILERFGKFWGAFSVIDLFLLNALTIVVGAPRQYVGPRMQEPIGLSQICKVAESGLPWTCGPRGSGIAYPSCL
jgi:hypothetical protein